jgi:hypothetical protein
VTPPTAPYRPAARWASGRIVGADIAHMLLFLAADTARMITAQEFVVDAVWS